MSAHPQLEMKDAQEMVRYILSLENEKTASLPTKGSYTTTVPEGDKGVGTYILRAAYRDNGANGIKSLSSEQTYALRNPNVQASKADELNEIRKFDVPNGQEIAIASASGAYLGFKDLDLTGINSISCLVSAPKEYLNCSGGVIEVRLGSPEGEVLGRSSFIEPTATPAMRSTPKSMTISIDERSGDAVDLYFVFVNEEAANGQSLFIINTVVFQNTSGTTARK